MDPAFQPCGQLGVMLIRSIMLKDAMVAEEHIHFLHENIPSSKQVIWPKGKHNLHLKYKEEFNQLVQQFL